MRKRIYLDHAATTPVASSVLAAMLPYFTTEFGNASSRSHVYGWAANQAVERASEQVADLLQVHPNELTFTSGSTESINLAIRGVAQRYQQLGRHLITAATAHSAVLDTCAQLEKEGFEVTYLSPRSNGLISVADVQAGLRKDTILCTMLWANNETGVVQDVAQIGSACRQNHTLFFCDATQAVGKVPTHPREHNIDLLACSAHKFYGPKGIGALWVSEAEPRVSLVPQIFGGGHQGGLRSGTLNVPGIVGMGEAAVLAKAEMASQAERLQQLRDDFEQRLKSRLAPILINGGDATRLPHIANISIRFTEAEALLTQLQRKVALATGSACASADLTPSHVLLAMGLSAEDAKAAIRVSLGRDTSAAETAEAARLIIEAALQLRSESPVFELYQDGIIN